MLLHCGTRLIHSSPGQKVLSVKGGCIEGLDWSQAKHIWCKRAMVPIPEGVEREEEEPTMKDNDLLPSDLKRSGIDVDDREPEKDLLG
ncbi:hypothetical protein DH86_00002142 [Scytalidium sp. 3C]|nr:hypothetical protein DH86_00002142 [Scytalidium sp. 3C]